MPPLTIPILNQKKPLKRLSTGLVFIYLAFLMGCQSAFGPTALHNTHPAYNQAITQSLNEQMLLNLIRLRYRDTPYFLKVNSVTAALTFDSNIGISSEIELASAGNLLTPSLGVGYADKPTLSFQPLQGEDFLKSVLSSISFDALLVMTQSGWSIERVFGLCVERMNNLYNAPSASGPTPELAPEFKPFKRALKLIRQLQLQHTMEMGSDNDGKELKILFKNDLKTQPQLHELLTLLELKQPQESSNLITLSTNFLHPTNNTLSIRPRSIASILFYLSQHIEVPPQHISAGLVTITKTAHHTDFNWQQTPIGEFFTIHYSTDYPENAFLSVAYKNYWFYIADNDLKSKATFMLLSQLFDLQAGQNQFTGPTLTLPVR